MKQITTYRELIEKINTAATEHGDHLLDLPVVIMFDGGDIPAGGVLYQPHMDETDDYEAEPEGFWITSY